jgi:hypothetical protein
MLDQERKDRSNNKIEHGVGVLSKLLNIVNNITHEALRNRIPTTGILKWDWLNKDEYQELTLSHALLAADEFLSGIYDKFGKNKIIMMYVNTRYREPTNNYTITLISFNLYSTETFGERYHFDLSIDKPPKGEPKIYGFFGYNQETMPNILAVYSTNPRIGVAYLNINTRPNKIIAIKHRKSDRLLTTIGATAYTLGYAILGDRYTNNYNINVFGFVKMGCNVSHTKIRRLTSKRDMIRVVIRVPIKCDPNQIYRSVFMRDELLDPKLLQALIALNT